MVLLRIALALLGLVAVITVVLAGGTMAYTKWRDNRPTSVAAPLTAPQTVPLQSTGKVDGHDFTVIKDGATAVATFRPFLPRDDAAVLRAASQAIAVGGYDTQLVPSSARLSGRHIVVRAANGKDYALLLVKEDTGEVHSIQIEER